MSDRLPPELRPQRAADTSALEAALHSETAFTLGKIGREVEAALASLADVRASGNEARLRAMRYECADIVWRYFVQRETCGLMQHDPVIEYYGIPPDVLAWVGARPPGPRG